MTETTDVRRLAVAKSLTRWMNGKRQDPLPDWDAMPTHMKVAYLEQAAEAIEACGADELDDLLRWKSEAMKVMDDLDLQEIGKEMGLRLGDNIAVKILPYIKELKGKRP
jgi:hypothetical protein